MKYNILIVDDELHILSSLELAFSKKYNVFCSQTEEHALDVFNNHQISVVLLDLSIGNRSVGLEILKKMKSINDEVEVIIITGNNDIAIAVKSIKQGAYDYITKPYDINKLKILVNHAIEKIFLKKEVSFLKIEQESIFDNVLIGNSPVIKNLKKLIRKVSSNKSTVLITGESGTGKEVVARLIHASGKYKDKPFVPVHTGAISENLIESELFGHEKGSFTGAHAVKKGKFENANEGTIFLDEISTMSQQVQIKLLRVLQDKAVVKVGSSKVIPIDVKVISATNKNIKKEVDDGLFREDLYYRLNVFPIEVPPLRERKEDIKILSYHFLNKYSAQLNKFIKEISSEALNMLSNYNWPGNIRELQNAIERAVILVEGDKLTLKDLPPDLIKPPVKVGFKENGRHVDTFEKEHLINVLKECNWNQTHAAKLLKVHRNTLIYKMKKFNINKEFM